MNLKHRIYRLFANLKQRTSRLLGVIIVCLATLFGLSPSANAVILRVATNGSCTGDGSGWNTNAFRYLQDALDAADNLPGPHQIWVAAGTYYADQSCANEDGTGMRTATFQLVKDVFLLGGFNGTETLPEQRDSVANPTILSGAVAQGQALPHCVGNGLSCFQEHGPGCLDEIDPLCCQRVCEVNPLCCESFGTWDAFCVQDALNECGGSYHVVTAGNEIDDPVNTVIDGFTIRDGWANGSVQLDQNHGGGMFLEGEPSVVRCTFTQNTALTEGGAMTIKGQFNRPSIINCIFEDNPGDPASPGDQQLFPTNGGALASIGLADPIFTNCIFVGNTAKQAGGAIYNVGGNCVGNPPPGGECARITLINCTVASNTADLVGFGHEGGGLYFNGSGRLDTENTIVWGNLPQNNQIDGTFYADAINYSDCEGSCPGAGTGNIEVDPLFVNVPDNLRLTVGSQAIDVGNPDDSVILDDIFDINDDGDVLEATPDLDLGDRVLGSDVDMGAYESCPWDLDNDCSVGIQDLLILIAAWGSDPGGPPDFNDDGDVGVSDLLELLANWGLCPCGVGAEPLSLAEELEDACLSQANWDDFVAMMGDPNASQEDKDRFYCWMVHYLDHCDKCTCTHIPTCPSPDPYSE